MSDEPETCAFCSQDLAAEDQAFDLNDRLRDACDEFRETLNCRHARIDDLEKELKTERDALEQATADFELATKLRDEAVSDLYVANENLDQLQSETEQKQERIEQLEADRDRLFEAGNRSLSWLASYPGGNAENIYNQMREALEPLESAGDSEPLKAFHCDATVNGKKIRKHEWDYTGSEASCVHCGMTASENPCKHLSISPPTFGAWRCCDCNMTFSERPQTVEDSES